MNKLAALLNCRGELDHNINYSAVLLSKAFALFVFTFLMVLKSKFYW